MPRKTRIDAPGAINHILSRGNDKQAIFRDSEDFLKFIRLLAQTKKMFPFRLYSQCLMPNHFHLLTQTLSHSPAVFMQRLLTCYAQYFNRRHGHVGHVFQGRYKAFPCTTDSYFHSLRKYIHNNPVRAGLVSRPEDWPWSGHNQMADPPGWGLIDSSSGLLLFDQSQTSHRNAMPEEDERHVFTDKPRLEARHSLLAQLAQQAAGRTGVSAGMMLGPRRLRSLTPARKLFASMAAANGYKVAEVASFLNRTKSSVFNLCRQCPQ
ncbi:MAG: transposase [Elusimicrobiota bacterium]